MKESRNPCFSRIAFAMEISSFNNYSDWVAILVLVEQLLQYLQKGDNMKILKVAILVLVEQLLQFKYEKRSFDEEVVAILVLVEQLLQ